MPDFVPPCVLTIAGSDSGGGAGIEADLKTMGALGCYGMAAITAVTAQNTIEVTAIHAIPPGVVAQQIHAVLSDIGAQAVKTGMLLESGIIEAVSAELARAHVKNLVVDPVMVAKSGDKLLREEARETLVQRLLPQALLVTPNVPEAEILAGCAIAAEADMARAAERILGFGPRYVLMKGGHLDGEMAVDYLFGGPEPVRLAAPRIDTKNTHGTGCTYSAAIACFLARGESIEEAAVQAKDYVTEAIAHALPLGKGHGPLHRLCRPRGEGRASARPK